MKIRALLKSGFKKPLLLLAVLMLGLLFASCVGRGTVPQGWSGSTVDNGTLFVGSMDGRLAAVDTTNGNLLWSVPLEMQASGGGFNFGCVPAKRNVAIYTTPAVAGDLVYIAGYNGKIYAFSRADFRQEPRWVYPREGILGDSVIGGIVPDEGSLYFGSADGKVYALNAPDGFKEWEFQTDDKVWATPAVSGDTLYIGSFDKKLYALNKRDGSKKWHFETGGAIVSTPLVDGDTVYIGSFDRYLYAINTADGSLKWKFMADNWFWAQPVIRNGTIYAGNLDGVIYALNAATGEKQAEFDLGSPSSSPPVLVDNLLIAATESGIIYSLNTDSNQQDVLANLEKKIYAPIAASQGKVYIHDHSDAIYEIDVASGAKREFDIKTD